MNRRRFLQVGGVGLLTIAGGSLFTDFHGAERVYPDTGAERNNGLPGEMLEIFSLAVLAPSGHNTQPWLIKPAGDNRFTISLNRKCLLPAVDPMNRESTLSIGAFLQNLILAAGSSGYSTETGIISGEGSGTDILELTLKKNTRNPSIIKRITGRRTVRNGYRQSDLSSRDLAFITGNDSINFHYFPKESQQGRFIAEGTVEANRVQAYRDNAQHELADWIRWSRDEAELKMDGLTPESMEIDGFAGWFVRNFYNRDSVLEPAFREKTVCKTIDQVHNCGGWIVITGPDMQTENLIETGKQFESMFLRIREKMIGIHPMTQLLEEDKFKSLVAGELGLGGSEVQFILRTGYLDTYPDPVSLRRPLSKVLLTNS